MFDNIKQKNMGARQSQWHQQSPQPCPRRKKRRVCYGTNLRERIESRKDQAYDCGCNTESLRDALVLVFPSHQSVFVTQYYQSEKNLMLICPHSYVSPCKKTKHTRNWCYRFLVKYIYIIYYCPHNT